MSKIFVSHASNDKDSFVRPLAHALKRHGLDLWYDEFSIRPGDSLRRSIDRGLAECGAGLVVLSPSFFIKEWPQRELDALLTAEVAGRSKIIPIWYEIDFEAIAVVSPLLADRFAIRAGAGVEEVASIVAQQFPVAQKISGSEVAIRIEVCENFMPWGSEVFNKGCQYRLLSIQAFREEYWEYVSSETSSLSEDEQDEFFDDVSGKLHQKSERLKKKYGIPDDVYLTTDDPEREFNFKWWADSLAAWASGTFSMAESEEFVRELDLAELDEYYVLVGVPNFLIYGEQRTLLHRALIEIGCGFDDGYERLSQIRAQLCALDNMPSA